MAMTWSEWVEKQKGNMAVGMYVGILRPAGWVSLSKTERQRLADVLCELAAGLVKDSTLRCPEEIRLYIRPDGPKEEKQKNEAGKEPEASICSDTSGIP